MKYDSVNYTLVLLFFAQTDLAPTKSFEFCFCRIKRERERDTEKNEKEISQLVVIL